MNEVISSIGQFGLVGGSFIFMLWWSTKENSKREQQYIETIKENQEIVLRAQELNFGLAQKLDVVEKIWQDVVYIKAKVD